MLGFDQDRYMIDNSTAKLITAANPPDMYFGSTRIFVYSNLVKSQIVGDTFAPLLYSFPIRGKQREVITTNPVRSYLDVERATFDTINIFWLNEFGEEITLLKGSTSITLHFRPKKPWRNGI